MVPRWLVLCAWIKYLPSLLFDLPFLIAQDPHYTSLQADSALGCLSQSNPVRVVHPLPPTSGGNFAGPM